MEACSGSNYWALKFQAMGHDVKLISPQYVKPYVKTNKNDQRDAEAICEAAARPNMRFVPIKSKDQKAIQCIHRMRSRLVNNRTALSKWGMLYDQPIRKKRGVPSLRVGWIT